MFIKFDLKTHQHISLGRGILFELTKEVYEVEAYPPQEEFFIPLETAKQYIRLGFAEEVVKPNVELQNLSTVNENTNRTKPKK